MKRILKIAAVAGLLAAAPAAFAEVNFSLGINLPGPAYVEPQPVYVAPQPVYVQPVHVVHNRYETRWERDHWRHEHERLERERRERERYHHGRDWR